MTEADRTSDAGLGRGVLDKLRQAADIAGKRASAVAHSANQSKLAARRVGKYVVAKNSAGQFHFTLHASNGQVIATSESYSSRAAALNGVNAIRKNAVQARLVDETGDSP